MALFPNCRCPKCKGPITFFEVMSILTPFQGIDCSTCGELVFLKHKMELFGLTILLAVLFIFLSVVALVLEIMSTLTAFLAGGLFFAAAEFLMTAQIVRKNDLVCRRNS